MSKQSTPQIRLDAALFQSPGQVAGIADCAKGHTIRPSDQGENMANPVEGHTLPSPPLGVGVALKNPDLSLGAHAVIPRLPDSAAEKKGSGGRGL